MKMEQIVFRNVGIYNSDAGELSKRKHNTKVVFTKAVEMYESLKHITSLD